MHYWMGNREVVPASDADRVGDVISRIVEPLHRALQQMNLTAYDYLVGDDTSGRIPTLVVRDLINRQRATKIPVIFIQTTRSDFEKSRERIGAWQKRKKWLDRAAPQRVLVVTECIVAGNHIKQIADQLDAWGIGFDVLAVESLKLEAELKRDRQLPGSTNLFAGAVGQEWAVYAHHELTGLTRDKFAEKAVVDQPAVRRSKTAARREVLNAADELGRKLGLPPRRMPRIDLEPRLST